MTSTFVSATTVDEAVSALADGARPVAGGTDLVVGARQGKAPLPESIVAIHRLDELRGTSGSDGGLRLGALVTHAEIAVEPVVLERLTRSPTRRQSWARTRRGRRARWAATS